MCNNPVVVIIGIIVLVVIVLLGVRQLIIKVAQFNFFNYYLGLTAAQTVIKSKRIYLIHRILSSITLSRPGGDIFDAARRTYSSYDDNEQLFEETKALLNAYCKKFFSQSSRSIFLTDNQMQYYCYSKTGFYKRPDIFRYLLWLLLLNPVGLIHLNEL
jgi:hypothetical protein